MAQSQAQPQPYSQEQLDEFWAEYLRQRDRGLPCPSYNDASPAVCTFQARRPTLGCVKTAVSAWLSRLLLFLQGGQTGLDDTNQRILLNRLLQMAAMDKKVLCSVTTDRGVPPVAATDLSFT